MNDQRNLILAIVLTITILLGFHYLYERPKQIGAPLQPQEQAIMPAVPVIEKLNRTQALAASQRLTIDTERLHGTINLTGGRLDDIVLKEFHETPDPKSAEITLLSPQNSSQGYFCEFGWMAPSIKTPDGQTRWEQKAPLHLRYDSGEGLIFERIFYVDENYMFRIEDKVTNTTSAAVSLKPYAQITRQGTPKTGGYYILHEGPIGVLNNTLHEFNYQKLIDKKSIEQPSQGGWLGITDKYWLVALIPQQDATVHTWFRGENRQNEEIYTTGFSGPDCNVASGQTLTYTHHVFTGAKKLRLLDGYEEKIGFDKFDLAVDFGWFYFLTKPLFYLLEYLNKMLGNLGFAIIVMTVMMRIVLYPLAAKSYGSMAKMKKFQPQMERLKERFGDDKIRLQQEIMALYKREGINPLSGCLPLLLQAPIFFCLYKVLFVTIEMRHAPFLGWIQDLSSPDPTTIFNLFGLLPWNPPGFLLIGAWPIIMGLTMFLQQKLSPQPADPAQAKIFLIMPIMLTFLLAQFPAGLVIYWAWTNILGILQQWWMMRQHG